MNQLNSLIIEGNVVNQPDLLEPADGFKVCKFTVAVNRWYKNKDGNGVSEVSFFDVETYGRMAEICAKQAVKGRGLRIVGRLQQDRWKDSENKSHSKVYVIAEHIEYKPKMQDTNETVKSEADVKKETAEPAKAIASVEQQSEMVEETVF